MRYLLEVAGDRQSEFAVRQSPCRDPCVLETDEVVPVPRPTLAADASLKQ